MRKIGEECGVFGAFSKTKSDLARLGYYGLFALQHRGQEAAGICVCADGVMQTHKADGLVGDIFTPQVLNSFKEAQIAVGHVRYSTTGDKCSQNAQPIVVTHKAGALAIAHNGNLTNYKTLRAQLESTGAIFHTTSDTEIISYIITRERLTAPSLELAVARTMGQIEGAYCLVVMNESKLIAVRDPHGYRPLCYGVIEQEEASEANLQKPNLILAGQTQPSNSSKIYIVASETAALDAVGAKFVRDIEPGEMVTFCGDEVVSNTEFCNTAERKTCAFEFIYFARPDSVIDGVSVHNARIKAGEILAVRHPAQADIVIGVPDSGLEGAMGYANKSGLPLEFGFLKNRYIGRTFISPGQSSRENLVSIKLNAISAVVEGKRLVVIDDSIVRGTTSRKTIQLLRHAGAAQIHMRITAPQFVSPCFWGVDIASREHLISCRYNLEEIAKFIGVDSLGFLEIEDLEVLCGGLGHCAKCFERDWQL